MQDQSRRPHDGLALSSLPALSADAARRPTERTAGGPEAPRRLVRACLTPQSARMATRWYLEANRDELMQVSGIFSRPQSRPSTMLPIHARSRSPFLNGVGQRIANDKPMANEDLAATGFWPLRASSSRPASDITSEAFKTRFASSPTCRAFPKTAVSLDSTGSLMRRSSPEHRELFMEWGRNGGCPGSATVVEPTMRPMTGTRSSPPWNHAVGLTQWVGLSRTAQCMPSACSAERD